MDSSLGSSPLTGGAPPSEAAGRPYYSVAQAAALLGVSRVTIWRWIRTGRLPTLRLGHRTTRIKREDLERFIAEGRTAGSRSRTGGDARAETATGEGVEGVPLAGADDRLRATAALQQQAASLEVEVAQRKAAEALLTGQTQVLEMIATGAPLANVLAMLIRLVEAQSDGLLGSILVRDPENERFRLGIAPSLPENYISVLAGAPISPPYLGPCDRAAHRGEEVITADIAADQRWTEEWRQLALHHGLRTCYASPIVASDGRVLGSFEMYYREPRDPKPSNTRLVETATHLAGIAIERSQAKEALRDSEDRLRALVAASSVVVYRMSPDWREMRYLQGREFVADTHEPSRTWLEKYIHPDDQLQVMEVINEAIRTKSIFELEHRVRRVDGTFGWTFSRAVPLLDANGDIVEWLGTASDVTRHKEAEEAARASQAAAERQRRLYEAILTNTPDLAYIFDLDHRFSYVNESMLKMWGRTREEAIGKTCLELGYPDWHAAMHDREIEQVIATKLPIRGEVPFSGAFGRRIYDYIFVPVVGADGEVEAVAGTTRDVTERAQAEALQAVEARVLEMVARRTPLPRVLTELARAVEALADGMLASVLLLDDDGRHLRHGAAPSLPDAYNRVIDGIEIGPAVGSCGTAAHRGERVVVTDIAVDPLWADFRDLGLAHGLRACWSTPIRGADGRVLGTFALYYRAPREPSPGDLDLIDRVARVAALAIERARVEAERSQLLQRERDARTDAQRAIARARHLQEITGQLSRSLDASQILAGIARSAAELLDVSVGAVFLLDPKEPESDFALAAAHGIEARIARDLRLPRHASLAGRAIDEGRTLVVNDVNKDPGTALPALLTGETIGSEIAAPITAGNERLGVVKAFSLMVRRFSPDDAEMLNALADAAAVALTNARLYQQVQEAMRMRDEFLAAAAHDLKTPLTTIKGTAQMLRRQAARAGIAAAEGLVEGLGGIDAAATKMRTQIDELLDLAYLQAGQQLELHYAPLDLVALAQRTAAEQRRNTDRHRIRIDTTEAGLVGQWDEVRLARVLDNLLTNAVKYSPDGGDITVTVARAEDATGESAVVAVRDQGLGIPAADLPHIFERFHRAGNVAETIAGSGIGLASARQIVEQHGGSIAVESREGEGSTFTIRLPLAPHRGNET